MRVVVVIAACLLSSAIFAADVVTYPAPDGENLSADYQIWVGHSVGQTG